VLIIQPFKLNDAYFVPKGGKVIEHSLAYRDILCNFAAQKCGK